MTYIIKNSIYRIVVLSVLMCPPVQMNGHMDSTGHIKMHLSFSPFTAPLFFNYHYCIILDFEIWKIFHETAELRIAVCLHIEFRQFRTKLFFQFAQIISLCAVSFHYCRQSCLYFLEIGHIRFL